MPRASTTTPWPAVRSPRLCAASSRRTTTRPGSATVRHHGADARGTAERRAPPGSHRRPEDRRLPFANLAPINSTRWPTRAPGSSGGSRTRAATPPASPPSSTPWRSSTSACGSRSTPWRTSPTARRTWSSSAAAASSSRRRCNRSCACGGSLRGGSRRWTRPSPGSLTSGRTDRRPRPSASATASRRTTTVSASVALRTTAPPRATASAVAGEDRSALRDDRATGPYRSTAATAVTAATGATGAMGSLA